MKIIKETYVHKVFYCLVVEKDEIIYKISYGKHPNRRNDILNEIKIIKHLNINNCTSSPQIIDEGRLDDLSILNELQLPDWIDLNESYFYSVRKLYNSGQFYFGDLLVAILEQFRLGVFHGDVKPENIISQFPLVLVDYDQALFLKSEDLDLDFGKFLKKTYLMDYDQHEISSKGWLRHFGLFYFPLFVDKYFFNSQSQLLLKRCSFYVNSISTNTKAAVYHEISNRYMFAKGIRNLDKRGKILDTIDFKQNEVVVDWGCNTGLLSFYLAGRQCIVKGVELDFKSVVLGRILNNINKSNVEFLCEDIDNKPEIGSVDTMMLFSFIHHTSDLNGNCKYISSKCKRIIIECRLNEWGNKPVIVDGKVEFRRSSSWAFEDLPSLYSGMENLFPRFKFHMNHGQVDKDRYILELRHVDLV